MSDIADYDADILLWSERQAALLRDLKGMARRLPHELDLENVAEEIESVGRSEFRAFESCLTQIFIHLMKAASNSDPVLRAGWESEIFSFQHEALKAMTPSMVTRLDLSEVWSFARHKAMGELRKHSETLNGVLRNCPFRAETFLVKQPLDRPPLLATMQERLEFEARS